MEITTTNYIPNYNGLKFMDECIRSLMHRRIRISDTGGGQPVRRTEAWSG